MQNFLICMTDCFTLRLFHFNFSNIALVQDGNLINFENRKPTVQVSKDSIKALAEKAMQRKAKELADSGGFVAFAEDDPELMFRRNPSFTPSVSCFDSEFPFGRNHGKVLKFPLMDIIFVNH